MSMDERLKTRADAEATMKYPGPLQDVGRAGAAYRGEAGQLNVACQEVGPAEMGRFMLEQRRDDLRRDANLIQALLDSLPAKLSYEADRALQGLVLLTK